MQSPTSFIFFACSRTSVHANWELDLCRGSSFLLLAVLLLGCKTAKLFCFVSMKWGRIEACFSNKKSARRRHPAGLTAGDAASWSPPPPTRYATVTLQVFERRAIYPSRSISDAIQHLSFGSSPFWKGVLWAYKAAQVGIRWKIGDDKTVKFWEDWWFGNCSLATQFWYLYIIADQKKCLCGRCLEWF